MDYGGLVSYLPWDMNLDKPVGKLCSRFQLFMPSADISKGDRLTPNRVNGHVEQDMYVAKSFQTMTKGCQNPVFSDSFRPSPDFGGDLQEDSRITGAICCINSRKGCVHGHNDLTVHVNRREGHNAITLWLAAACFVIHTIEKRGIKKKNNKDELSGNGLRFLDIWCTSPSWFPCAVSLTGIQRVIVCLFLPT